MTVSDTFGNHWKAVPYSAAALISGDAFLILFHLMRKSKGFMSEEPVVISRISLSLLIGKSRNSTKNSINELKEFNLIFEEETEERKPSSFTINWKEIMVIHSVCSKISDDGVSALREKCRECGVIPLSKLNQLDVESIVKRFSVWSNFDQGNNGVWSEFDQGNNGVWSNSDQGNTPHGQNLTKESSGYGQILTMKDLSWSEFDQGNFNFDRVWSKFDHDINLLGQILTIAHEKLSKNEDGVKNYNKLLKKVTEGYGQILTKVWSNSDQETHFPWSNSDHYIRDNIREKRDEYGEAVIEKEEKEKSLQDIISSAKASEKRVFLDLRNLELPRYSYSDFQFILDNPRYNNSDSDKMIQEVWKEIEPEEKDEWEEEQRTIIPVSLFNKILYDVWSSLKEELPDFSLTEEQAKNIFGFEVVEMEDGDFGYVIDSSYVRNINEPSEPDEEESEKDDNLQFSRMNERIARELFVESLKEIADKDINALTDMEYAVLRLDDFVVERQQTGMPRFDEVTAIFLDDLIQDTAREAKVSENALKCLSRAFKKKPKSPTARIRISALDFKKIFEYNLKQGQESVVESLLNEKLAAYKDTTASNDLYEI